MISSKLIKFRFIILMDIYSAGEQNLKGISAYDFVEALRKKDTKALFAKNLKKYHQYLKVS